MFSSIGFFCFLDDDDEEDDYEEETQQEDQTQTAEETQYEEPTEPGERSQQEEPTQLGEEAQQGEPTQPVEETQQGEPTQSGEETQEQEQMPTEVELSKKKKGITARICQRRLRDSINVLDMPDHEFTKCYRMNKDCFKEILKEISPMMKTVLRTTSIPPILRLETFLRFLGAGNYQKNVGKDNCAPMSQAKVSRIISECLDIFEEKFCPKWIQMEMTKEEETANIKNFYSTFDIPGVIGCVDCTQIKIVAPGIAVRQMYENAKGFYSINALMICDYKKVIRYVDATQAGSSNDAYVWNESPVSDYFIRSFNEGQRNKWLLGDSGYKLFPYLLTPYTNPSQSYEREFNERLQNARSIIEGCFGVLKNRFRCIYGDKRLHYTPATATKIINACCALHNACIFYKNEWPFDNVDADNDTDENSISKVPTKEGLAVRDKLARSMAEKSASLILW